MDQYCFNVAIGLVGLANIFDPALIAISGGLVNDGELFLDPMRRHFLGHIEGADVPADSRDRARGAGGARRRHRGRDPRARSHRRTPVGSRRDVRLGLTLPSFVEDPEPPLAVARAAEAAGLHGVFVFDHLFRTAAVGRAAARAGVPRRCWARWRRRRERISIGTLVARATLRPPATLAAGLDTVLRIAGPRLLVGLGAGDEREPGRDGDVRPAVRHRSRTG